MKNYFKNNKINFQGGPARHWLSRQAMAGGQAIMISLIFFIIISLALISGGTLPTGDQIKNSSDFLKSRQSFSAADATNDNVFYMLNKGHSVSGGATLPFSSGNLTASIGITDLTNKKQIITTGNSNSAIRLSKIVLSQNFGTNFNYGIQAGSGGVIMNNANIIGDLYSIGNISGNTSSTITGTTTVAYTDATHVGKIIGSSNSQYNPLKIIGNAWAHEINYTKVSSGVGFCKTSNYLLDSSNNVIGCDSRKNSDPSALSLPVSSTNITNWKNAVTNQTDTVLDDDTYNGDWNIGTLDTNPSVKKVLGNLSCSDSKYANFGNLYVTGNLSISGSCVISTDALHVGGNLLVGNSGVLDLSGMSYVVGNINVSGSGKIKLDGALGASTGYVISDGTVTVGNSASLNGSGTTGSYIMLISTSVSASAISVSGTGSAALLVAPNGQVNFQGGTINGIVAKTVNITGGTLTYQSYLGNMVFGGPASGPWNVLNWNEVSN